jgi:hypothetical protein
LALAVPLSRSRFLIQHGFFRWASKFMKALAAIKNWLIKLGLAPLQSEQKPALQQLEELVAWTAKTGHGEEKSKYYTHPHGQYADFKDFDTDRMIEDFSAAFSSQSQSA